MIPIWRKGLWTPAAALAVIWAVMFRGPEAHWDEAATSSAAGRSLTELVHMLGNIDAVHGLYYLILHPFYAVLGPSLAVGRLVSGVAACVAVAGLTLLGTRLLGARFGLIVGFTFVLLPVVADFAILARSYSLVAAIVVWATYILTGVVLGWLPDSGRWWVIYGLLLVAGIYVSIVAATVLVAHWATAALVRRVTVWRRFLVTSIVVLLLAIPLVVVSFGQRGHTGGTDPLDRSVLTQLPGYWVISPKLESGTSASLLILTVWLVALFGLAHYVFWQKSHSRGDITTVYLIAGPWVVLPIFFLMVWSLREEMMAARLVFLSAPGFALLVALGIWQLRYLWLQVGVLVLLLVLALPVMAKQREPLARGNLDSIADLLAAEYQTGDAIVYVPARAKRIAGLYPEVFDQYVDIASDQSAVEAGDLNGTATSQAEFADRLEDVGRVWIVQRPTSRGQLPEAYAQELRDHNFALSRDFALPSAGKQPTLIRLYTETAHS